MAGLYSPWSAVSALKDVPFYVTTTPSQPQTVLQSAVGDDSEHVHKVLLSEVSTEEGVEPFAWQ